MLSQLAKHVEGWDPPKDSTVSDALVTRIISAIRGDQNMDGSQTELDSHAHMCVFGRNSMIISESNRSVDVNAFAEEARGIMKVPIADIMVAYDCKRTHRVFLLIARNALYVESMENNLVHPFILREAGLC